MRHCWANKQVCWSCHTLAHSVCINDVIYDVVYGLVIVNINDVIHDVVYDVEIVDIRRTSVCYGDCLHIFKK